MIEPQPGKAEPDQERRFHQPQAFAEIGGVLLGHPVLPVLGDRGLRLGADRIEIADHRRRHPPRRQRPVGPAIGRNQQRRQAQRQGEVIMRKIPTAKQGDAGL